MARWRSPTRWQKKGLWVVGVPKTIDNDLAETVITFGFDTAASFATECLDRLHTTAALAQARVMVVEVMGRYAGWIALESGISGSADIILIPEIPYDLDKVAAKILEHDQLGRKFCIVMVSEGASRRAEGKYQWSAMEFGASNGWAVWGRKLPPRWAS